jgi:hypothetical protein
MNRIVIVTALVLGTGAGLLAAHLSSRAPRAAAPVADGAEPSPAAGADVSSELAALRARLARMEQADRARGEVTGNKLAADAESAANAAAREQLTERINRVYTPAVEAKRFGTYFAGLDNLRRTEGVDLPFQQHVHAAIEKALASGSTGLATLKVPSVECGRTLCRVEIDSSNPALKSVAITELTAQVAGDLPTASVFVPPDSNHMVAYFAKAGADLPDMEPLDQVVADLP